ncbi:MAG TPA: hypothetical protein V6C81_24350 [Planktothrix sp.]|jgi:hypothetical protein
MKKKNRYVVLCCAGTALGAVIGALSLNSCNFGSFPLWIRPLVIAFALYSTFTGSYFGLFLAALWSILDFEGIWKESRLRTLGVPVLGSTLGLVLLGWIALVAPQASEFFSQAHLSSFPDTWKLPIYTQETLVPQAYFLSVAKIFVDYAEQFAALFAAFAMLTIGSFDRFKPPWYITTIVLGFLVPIPAYMALAIAHVAAIDSYFESLVGWTCISTGVFGTVITVTVALVQFARRGSTTYFSPEQIRSREIQKIRQRSKTPVQL